MKDSLKTSAPSAPPDPLLEQGLLYVNEVVAQTRLARSTIYGLMGSGQLAYCKIGKRRLIPRAAVNDLLSKSLVPARA